MLNAVVDGIEDPRISFRYRFLNAKHMVERPQKRLSAGQRQCGVRRLADFVLAQHMVLAHGRGPCHARRFDAMELAEALLLAARS
ncbi:MAG TPA: hypothetical protein VMV69_26365 [Pirellulales bacterium]|nr:hypothetical protein [Pirellulales bacterium]